MTGFHAPEFDGEFTPEEAWVVRRSMRTVMEDIADHVEYRPVCFAVDLVGPVSDGVMALTVCGLPKGHDGPHRAGWTGHGQTWTAAGAEGRPT